MSTKPAPAPLPFLDDRITIASIAVLAYIVADVAHEGAGHTLGFYLAGGKSALLTTTRLIVWVTLGDPQWRIFDLGGPVGNFVCAFLAWLGLRSLRTRRVHLRLFFWLVICFNLFWVFGYLIFSGVTGRGDNLALIAGTRFLWPGRMIFVIAGILLYRASIRLTARELRAILPVSEADSRARVIRLVWLCYIAGGLIACAGAFLDPRGHMEMLKSGALSSFAGALGLLYIPRNFLRLPEAANPPKEPLGWELPWVLAAAAAAIYFIAILGPGIQLWLGD